ncbi:twitching motility protein PilT [Thermosulfidibacter takaii ABI70S6]|uniref:Twitching motility protein PilT n=1 Tax=Thermosulfidibacter takaii (strain DSM 17441 / JCM 13301 / NBRC 103674 / ABI70S6) TaxID=1298851 RepID=A0A0S3QU60_THET7|nr:type IV pilus twitching motility protein PilT [Thermosulfidibacter takaii]BAT71865.1 twitching motility protein PilT [Thermosulfidibacter takaii ABI70S6]
MSESTYPATMEQLLRIAVEQNATDLHISTGNPPRIRVHGRLIKIEHLPPLTPADTQRLCYSVMNEHQRKIFEQNNEVDFSFGIARLSRFRANVFMQRGSVAGAFRRIPFEIIPLENLGLPPVVKGFVTKPKGLILVTGPTGSGKSTTLAAMIDRINSTMEKHIITIEDPIEYLHQHKKCLVNQREVGADTQSFKDALRYVLRQDPDVVLIGEMRDLESIAAALTVAETGHLTFATLHTNSAIETINRIIDVFPPHQQSQVRAQLSHVLEGIITQKLLPRSDGRGLVLAAEVLVPTPAVRNLIREDKIHQVYTVMQAGQSHHGMQTMNQALASLYERGLITYEQAVTSSYNPDELIPMLDRIKMRLQA